MSRKLNNGPLVTPHPESHAAQAGTPRAFHGGAWLRGFLLALAVVLAYQPAWHAGFIWDDDEYVTKNPLLWVPDGLGRIWFSLDSPSQYFPLVYTTFRIEHSIWGLDPAGYHWVNITLHAANALLAWRLLARLKIPGAWLAAMVFALHPIQVESVAWITERKNVLSAFFFLLALLAWTEFLMVNTGRKWIFYVGALAGCALALFSKTTACTIAAPLVLILWWKRQPIDRPRLLEIAPFLALGVGMGSLSMWWERYHQGTHGELFHLGVADRVLIASHAVWFYLGKLFWPVNLTFSYPRWTLRPWNPLSYGWLLAGAGICSALYFAREKTGRGVGVAFLFFVATLSPMLGFIMLYTFRYSFVADHYQYVASLGPIALVAAGVVTFAESRKNMRPALYGATAILILALGALTWKQCHIYHDSETLWRDTLAKNPVSWLACNDLGLALQQKGDTKQAAACYKSALELNPAYPEALTNLGTIVYLQGHVNEAIADYEKALEIDSDFPDAHYNLGLALEQTGDMDDALFHFQKALGSKYESAKAHNNLGNLLLQRGNVIEAAANYRQALDIDPSLAEAHNNLGAALLQMGRAGDALAHFQRALDIEPGFAEARYNLAHAYQQTGQARRAIDAYQKVLAINPDLPQALNNLAYLLAVCPEAGLRNGPAAVELAQRANDATGGGNAFVLQTLAAAYAETGRFPDAVKAANQALELADSGADAGLADEIRKQITFYQAGKALRDARLGGNH